MAILHYKKDGDPNKIRAMPVISSVYTDYVIENTGPAQTITLTPSTTTGQTGAGAFENVIANIKFLNMNPTYAPALTQQTYTFSTLYGDNGFPSAVTVSAIPTTTLSLTPTETTQTETFNTTRGFPTTVTVNPIPSNYLNKLTQASTPPATTTITTPSESITIDAGYYNDDITISANITNNGNIKNYLTIKPSTKDTIWPTGYYTGGGSGSSANGKLNIQTGTLTLTANNTYTPSTINGAIWGDFFPTSITVAVPDFGIDNSSGTAYATLYNNRNKIPSEYRVYGSGSSDYVTGTMISHTHSANTITNLTTQGATRTIEAGWHDGNETIKVNLPDITPSTNIVLFPGQYIRTMPAGYYGSDFYCLPATNSKTITSNGDYDCTDDGYYYSSIHVNVQNGSSMTDNGTYYSITSNGTHTIATSSSYYSKVYVNVQNGTSMTDNGTYSVSSNGTYTIANSSSYYSKVSVTVPTTTSKFGTFTGKKGYTMRWEQLGSILFIRGYDYIPDFSGSNKPPWWDDNDEITKVIIGNGVWGIGDYSFYWNENIQEVQIGQRVDCIGTYAFANIGTRNNSLLEFIDIPRKCFYVGPYAFKNVKTDKLTISSESWSGFSNTSFGNLTVLSAIECPWSSTNTNLYGAIKQNSSVSVSYDETMPNRRPEMNCPIY